MDVIFSAILREATDNNRDDDSTPDGICISLFFCSISARPRIGTDQRVGRTAIFMLVWRIVHRIVTKSDTR